MHRSLLLTVIACIAGAPAFAQVTVDLRALDALPHRPSATAQVPQHAHRSRRSHAKRASKHAAHVARQHAPSAVTSAPVAAAPQKSPAAATAAPSPASSAPGTPPPVTSAPVTPPPAATLPANPPTVATIPPVAPPPAPANPTPPPVPPVAAAAKTAAANVPAGLQLTFESGQSDLSAASVDAIKQFIAASPAGKGGTFNVLAYAAGVPHDPSAPRRLSLSRAIAVRSAMLAEGVSSAAIYLRALGAQGGDGPPDRVDISVQGGNASGAGAHGGVTVPTAPGQGAAQGAGGGGPGGGGAGSADTHTRGTPPADAGAASGGKSQ